LFLPSHWTDVWPLILTMHGFILLAGTMHWTFCTLILTTKVDVPNLHSYELHSFELCSFEHCSSELCSFKLCGYDLHSY
jgi:hypothetical protein